MSRLHSLKLFVSQRLTAAVDEIFGHLEKTITEYEEELDRKLLEVELVPDRKLRRAADVQQPVGAEEQVPPEQQDPPEPPHIKEEQQDPPEPPHIKEEQEEVWTSRQGEQLQGPEEAHITEFPLTPVPVKSEDDEEEAQSSQLHHRHTEHMETEADGEDCGGPGPDRNPHPRGPLEAEDQTGDCSEPETEDSEDWEETREAQSGLNFLMNHRYNSCEKSFRCSECGKRFNQNSNLKTHMRIHTGEKPFSCSVCGIRFCQKAHLKNHLKRHTGEKPFSCSLCQKCFSRSEHLQLHMRTHTGEKPFSCSACAERFTWLNQLKNHKCVSESSRRQEVWTGQEDGGGPEPAGNSGPDGLESHGLTYSSFIGQFW